jgi:hypothetical protein
MMRNLMTTPPNLIDQMRPARNPLPHYEESSSCAMAFQKIENSRSIFGVRTIIHRQPDFLLIGLEGGDNPAKPLARRHKQMVQNKSVGSAEKQPPNRRPRLKKPPSQRRDFSENFAEKEDARHRHHESATAGPRQSPIGRQILSHRNRGNRWDANGRFDFNSVPPL